MLRCLRSHQTPKTGLTCTVCISGFMFNFFKNQLIKPPYENILIEQAGCRLSVSQWRRSWSPRWVPLWTACKDGGNQGLKWAAFQRLQLMNKKIWLMHITVQWFNFLCSAAWHCFQWWHEHTGTGAGDRPTDLLIGRWPVVRPEPQSCYFSVFITKSVLDVQHQNMSEPPPCFTHVQTHCCTSLLASSRQNNDDLNQRLQIFIYDLHSLHHVLYLNLSPVSPP